MENQWKLYVHALKCKQIDKIKKKNTEKHPMPWVPLEKLENFRSQ